MQSPSSCYHSLWVETWYSVPAFPQLFLVLSIPLQTPMKIISQWILHIWHFFNPEWLHTLRDNWGLSLAPLPRKTSFSNSLVSTSLWKKKYNTSQAETCGVSHIVSFPASSRLGFNCTHCSAVICCCSLRCAARRASIVVIWWASCSTAPIRLAWVRSGAAEVGCIPAEGRKHVEVCLRKSIHWCQHQPKRLQSLWANLSLESMVCRTCFTGTSEVLCIAFWMSDQGNVFLAMLWHHRLCDSYTQLPLVCINFFALKRIRFSFPSPPSIWPTGCWLQKRAGVFPCACGAPPHTAWRAAPDEHAGTAGVQSPGWKGSKEKGGERGTIAVL